MMMRGLKIPYVPNAGPEFSSFLKSTKKQGDLLTKRVRRFRIDECVNHERVL